MAELILRVLEALVELLFIRTAAFVLRPFNIVLAPSFSLVPFRRQQNGAIGMQEWLAAILGMIMWAFAGIVLFALFR
jgi:hypothetical protein